MDWGMTEMMGMSANQAVDTIHNQGSQSPSLSRVMRAQLQSNLEYHKTRLAALMALSGGELQRRIDYHNRQIQYLQTKIDASDAILPFTATTLNGYFPEIDGMSGFENYGTGAKLAVLVGLGLVGYHFYKKSKRK